MSDKTWGVSSFIVTAMIVVGGLSYVYFSGKGQLTFITEHAWVKYLLAFLLIVGIIFIVYSEVRKRVEVESIKTLFVTIFIIGIAFAFFALTRL
ncbi:hypothetical protein [Lederbergia ruris]|uniref:Uncharacterized protein n=1 Tax=Lederbergia ruris TaxID=217495 RepID=A0ABQ4KJI6_9BACI|nr:hypothetical protein [Lederbergia ruris]GIN58125.1 hypothetical protein J8TS2_24440 [Lederbergia ruris]